MPGAEPEQLAQLVVVVGLVPVVVVAGQVVELGGVVVYVVVVTVLLPMISYLC